MNAQLHLSDNSYLYRQIINPLKNSISGPVKPTGGLWTSTYDGYSSQWARWCVGEEYVQGMLFKFWHVLYPAKDVHVAVIDSLVDLKRLLFYYGYGNVEITHSKRQGDSILLYTVVTRLHKYLDFERLAKDYDGLRLTSRGERITRLSTPGLYGWDVESTVWFRWCFRDTTYLIKRPCVPLEIEYTLPSLRKIGYDLLNEERREKMRDMLVQLQQMMREDEEEHANVDI